MEGCLYQSNINDGYCLVDSVASHFIIINDLETFKQQFVQKDVMDKDFEKVDFNSGNLIEVLSNYEIFQNEIDMNDFKDFNYIVFKQRRYYIRNWRDVYDFILNLD